MIDFGGGPDRAWMNPEHSDEWGLVGVGGDLTPERLLRAYSEGVFPWFSEGEPVCWWSPDPRAVFEDCHVHCPKRLTRTIRSGKFEVTADRAFRAVMLGCAERAEGTWVTQRMIRAYCRLHRLGHAHSVEVWHDGKLAGGIYGVSMGALFAGESMFHRVTDASKVALVSLSARLRERGYELFDIQMLTEHTASMGAAEIPRREYLRRARRAVRKTEITFRD